jgi:hypothetical protein
LSAFTEAEVERAAEQAAGLLRELAERYPAEPGQDGEHPWQVWGRVADAFLCANRDAARILAEAERELERKLDGLERELGGFDREAARVLANHYADGDGGPENARWALERAARVLTRQ